MIDRSRPDTSLNRLNRQFAPRSLAKFLASCLLFISLAVALSESALGCTRGSPARQSAQAPRGAGSKADDEKEARLLKPGKAIKRELAGGIIHTTQIRVGCGPCQSATVDMMAIY